MLTRRTVISPQRPPELIVVSNQVTHNFSLAGLTAYNLRCSHVAVVRITEPASSSRWEGVETSENGPSVS